MECKSKRIFKFDENLEFKEVGFILENNCDKCKRIEKELIAEEEYFKLRTTMLDNQHRKEEAKRLAEFEEDFFNGIFTKIEDLKQDKK